MAEVVTKTQTRAMGQRVLQMFSDVLNSIADDFENLPHPIIRAFSITGSTVTATSSNGTVLTATESNGVWIFKLPSYGEWTVKSVTPSSGTFFKVVNVDDVKTYPIGVGKEIYRYGYRIKEAEPDPYKRVEYIYDAVDMTPAHMDFESDTFVYGDWADVWFVKDNKPLMLKSDGTVDYYLDPNDYSKKENGDTDTDVANADYDGNAMAQFPLCWLHWYGDDTYKYVIVSNVQYDENYNAYAHTRADGSIADYFYWGIYLATNSTDNTKLRSLSFDARADANVASDYNAALLSKAVANGAGHSLMSWSQYMFIRSIATLISKSTNSQAVFGYDKTNISTEKNYVSSLNTKGQFYGEADFLKHAKMFHVINLCGNARYVLLGILFYNGYMYFKMTPEDGGYNAESVDGYTRSSIYRTGTTASVQYFPKDTSVGEYGFFPSASYGSISTYYCDYCVLRTNSNIGSGIAFVDTITMLDVPSYIGLNQLSVRSSSLNWTSNARLTYV